MAMLQPNLVNEASSIPPSLLDLPPELLEPILADLVKRDFKTLRLACHQLHVLATPRLFKHFSLYPHLQSFKKLEQIADTTGLSSLVHSLDYNTAFRAIARLPLRHFVPSENGSKWSSQSDGASSSPVQKHRNVVLQQLRQIHSETFIGGNTSDELTQTVFLQHILPKLSCLNQIRVFSMPMNTELPHFYSAMLPAVVNWSVKAQERLCKDLLEDVEPRQSYALPVLAASGKLHSLETFEMHGVDWDDFLGQPDMFRRPILYTETLKRLKSLAITTRLGAHHWDGDVTINLQEMLRHATNLERLIIWFRKATGAEVGGLALYDWENDEFCKSNFQLDLEERETFEETPEVYPELTWSSNVQYLELKGLICTTKELKNVLRKCSASLKHLNLSDLIILPETKLGPRACLVRLLKWMHKRLQLDTLGVKGFLTNGGMQDWRFLDPAVHPTTDLDPQTTKYLADQIIDFVIKDEITACPLDHLEIPDKHFDLGKPTYTQEAPEWLQKDKTYHGDDTILMRYNDHEDVPSDEESDEDEDENNDSETGTDTDSDSDSDSDDSTTSDDWESATGSEDDEPY